jgi:hypothetical protein
MTSLPRSGPAWLVLSSAQTRGAVTQAIDTILPPYTIRGALGSGVPIACRLTTFRHTRLTLSLPTAYLKTAKSARRTRRALVVHT